MVKNITLKLIACMFALLACIFIIYNAIDNFINIAFDENYSNMIFIHTTNGVCSLVFAFVIIYSIICFLYDIAKGNTPSNNTAQFIIIVYAIASLILTITSIIVYHTWTNTNYYLIVIFDIALIAISTLSIIQKDEKLSNMLALIAVILVASIFIYQAVGSYSALNYLSSTKYAILATACIITSICYIKKIKVQSAIE